MTADKRLKSTIFYLDESVYSGTLRKAMEGAGARVRIPSDACGRGASDEEWLHFAATEGWAVIMRDQRIRYRVLERAALTQAGVGAFVFNGGQASASETACVICRLLPKFCNMHTSESKPFLYSFGLSGKLSRIRLK